MGTCALPAFTVQDFDYFITVKRSLRQNGPSDRHSGRCPPKTMYVPSSDPLYSSLRDPNYFIYYLLIGPFCPYAPDHALAQLFDSAEPVPFQTVRQMIHSELEEWPESLFIEFDEIPLGSAVCLTVPRPSVSPSPPRYFPTPTPYHQH